MILTYFGVKRNLNHTQELNGPEPTCQFLWVIAEKHFYRGDPASKERIAKGVRGFQREPRPRQPRTGGMTLWAAGQPSHPAAIAPLRLATERYELPEGRNYFTALTELASPV